MISDLAFTIDSLHQAYKLDLKPEEVIDESLARIANTADQGIYLYLADKLQLSEAINSLGPFDLTAKPLWGIPFAVKDNIDVKGMPTTAACEAFRYIAEQDAHVISLLKAAGAIVIGKTNLDQFATGLVGLRSPFPAPKNAINPKLVPGGSSSGSSVTVSHGHVSFSLGTDTAGSGRIPAALNNIIGLKPTLGSISSRGVIPACRSLDTVSIFALTVADAAQVYRCSKGEDPDDAFSKPYTGPDQQAIPARLNIAIPDFNSLIIDEPEQREAYLEALNFWKQKGATLIEIDFTPFYEVAKLLYEGPWVAERLAAIAPFIAKHPNALHPITDKIISAAHNYSASDAFNASYRLQALTKETRILLKNIDLMCVPSMPGMVYTQDIARDPITPNSRLGTYTNFVNLLDLCALSVPGKSRQDGLPSSITLIADNNCDALLQALAADFHQHQDIYLGATKHKVTAKSITNTTDIDALLCDHEISLAVVGAHMSDLPLNYQLTEKGGRFLCKAETDSTYRLYQLDTPPPLRPGLVKHKQGEHLAVEIWAIPKSELGDLIEQIPSPLCIGSITLSDQQQTKGFLCESYMVEESGEISHFGGWRKFCQSTCS